MDLRVADNKTVIGSSLSKPTNSKMKTRALIGLTVVLLLVATGTARYFYKQLNNLKSNPNKVTVGEANAVIEAVGKLVVLPTDEQPTLATVTDPEKLKDQPFFAQAKVGNKVLIYTKAKMAILYDPSINKIVAVAPINTGDNAD